MPTSLSIAAFVLGAVLVLVSLLSGGFKLFGAEVSGTTGAGRKFVAFIVGIILIIVGFATDSASNREAADERALPAAPSRSEAEVPSVATSPSQPPVETSVQPTATREEPGRSATRVASICVTSIVTCRTDPKPIGAYCRCTNPTTGFTIDAIGVAQ